MVLIHPPMCCGKAMRGLQPSFGMIFGAKSA